MKNFISLALIALIFMTGCKSKSFMAQRYTKLGHASHKHIKKEPIVNRENKKIESVDVVPAVSAKEELAPGKYSILKEEAAKDDNKLTASAAPKKITDPLIHVGNKALVLLKNEIKKSGPQKVTAKKTIREKVHKAAGILNTALKIVLFAVVLAILVAIIIIIILT